MILVSAVLILCPGRFEKKLISMLAVSFIVISLTKGDFSVNLRGEYDSVIEDAQRYADDIRGDAEKYNLIEKNKELKENENTE